MNNKPTQTLIDHYLEGETTCEEERFLREYFSQTDTVPDEWRVYKALFALEGFIRAKDGMDGDASRPQTDGKPVERSRHKRSYRPFLLAAASLAAAIGLAIAWPEGTADCAYIDGRRTTDATVVQEEAEAALALVACQEEDIFGIMNNEIIDAI